MAQPELFAPRFLNENVPNSLTRSSQGRTKREMASKFDMNEEISVARPTSTGRQLINKDGAVRITYFLLRVVAGLLFIQTGGLILFGWFGGMPGQPSPPPLLSETGIGGILEFFGGIAIALGLGTRPVAFILSGTMAVAYWQFHAPNAVSPVQNQGVAAVLFCFLFLYLSARGGGDWSVDAILGPKSRESRTRRR
jgi:putative oxidoreductase